MKFNRTIFVRSFILISLIASLTGLSTRLQADTGSCGGVTITLPFNDVMASPFFCQIAAAYYSGLTNGTTATTYSPTQTVTREQMAAFMSRTLDQSLKRRSRKAVAKKWFIPQDAASIALTDVGINPSFVEFDGTDLWVSNQGGHSVMRVRPGDGKVLDIWTGPTSPNGIVCAMGKVFVVDTSSGNSSLYMIDPSQPAGPATLLTSSLGAFALNLAFDGSRIWSGNLGSVSIVSLNPTTVTTVNTSGALVGILFDGSNIWATNKDTNSLVKFNSDGSIAQTVAVGQTPRYPVFDGTNIWVPNNTSNSVSVVRVKDAQGNPLTSAFVLATLTPPGLSTPFCAAFDGERVLVTPASTDKLFLWKASDLSLLGNFPAPPASFPAGACSDGLNFWITLNVAGKLARF